MIIERVLLHHLRMPLASPFETSFGRATTRDSILITIFSEGLVGFGECVADRWPGFSYETVGTAWHVLHEFIVPAVLQADLADIAAYRDRVAAVRGHPMAKAGVEMALWDLLGKRANRSLSSLLGGVRSRVPVGVSVGIQDSPEALVAEVGDYLAEGYGRVKIKIRPGRDVGDTRAVRAAFPELPLQVDANAAYSLESAEALLPLDELDLLLIEQPLSGDDLWDHRHLQERFETDLCLDESVQTPRHARQALEMGACRVINIKAGRVGGLSQAVRIHDLCHARGVAVWCGGMLETGIGRAANLALAALPGFTLPGDISATARYYEQDINEQVFSLQPDSTIEVPDRPGLGVSVDVAALQKFTRARSILP